MDDVRTAAEIWARAAARRDGSGVVVDVDRAEAGVRRRLELDHSWLLLERRDGTACGFVLAAPAGAVLELFYLAVDPMRWGTGVAASLLDRVVERARSVGAGAVELWVVADNARAVGVYEAAGWVATGETQVDEPSGRVERRMRREIG